MLPHDAKRRSQRDGIARARILLRKNMGWLPGCPGPASKTAWISFPWEAPGSVQSVVLSGELLRRMEMTLTKLRYHFPRALPKVIPDVDDWLARMDHLLTLLKACMHEDQSLNVDDVLARSPFPARWQRHYTSLRERFPNLRSYFEALYFLELTKRGPADIRVLDWSERHGEPLSRLVDNVDLATLLALHAHAPDVDPHWFDRTCTLLSEQHFRTALFQPRSSLEGLEAELRKALQYKGIAAPVCLDRWTWQQAHGEFLSWLLGQSPKKRAAATALLAAITPEDIVDSLREVSEYNKRLTRMVSKLAHHPLSVGDDRFEREKVKESLERPDQCNQHLEAAENLASSLETIPVVLKQPSLTNSLLKLFSHLAVHDRSLCLRLFTLWEHQQAFRAETHSATVIGQIGQFIGRRGLCTPLVQHWSQVKRNSRQEFVLDLINNTENSADTKRALDLLEQTAYNERRNLTQSQLMLLSEFAIGGTNVLRAGHHHASLSTHALFVSTLTRDIRPTSSDIKATLAIGTGDADDARILEAICGDFELAECLETLAAHVEDERVRCLIRHWILSAEKTRLKDLALWIEALRTTGTPLPTIADIEFDEVWLQSYPSTLHGPLRELARVAPQAVRIAANLLSDEFPHPDRLRRELQWIEQTLAQQPEQNQAQSDLCQHLARRRDNLIDRINHPAVPSQSRLLHVAESIASRVDQEFAQRYIDLCRQAIRKQLQSEWDIDADVDALIKPPYDRLTQAIFQLDAKARRLGVWILARRMKDRADDFREDPRNAAFLDSMQRLGIDMKPWLDRNFQTTARDANGNNYTLSFTRDSLDVLLMGKHFRTCLSPGEFNFFSTLANAVDINKQVVYGRAAKGYVVGRCLFTLTDDGAILSYHRYAHDPQDRFAEAVDAFARNLSHAMNARLARSGAVSRLVAKDWYDDGPVRPVSLPDMQPGGPVRQLLTSGERHGLIDTLIALFGDEDILQASLPDLLELPECVRCPDVIDLLVSRYGLDPSVPFPHRMQLATVAFRAGMLGSSITVAESFEASVLLRALEKETCRECCAFHEIGEARQVYAWLTAYNPTLTLRLLRRTRRKGIRSDREEIDPERRRALAQAHAKLGRKRLVTDLL